MGLVINISGFAQWVDAQKRLAALEPAPTVDIGSLSPRSVEITVTYAGGMEAFRALVRGASERGRCVVYTTQFPELAARLADRVVVIGRGRIMLDETTAGLDPAEVERRISKGLELEGAPS